ncbi:homoserine O-succinyltransferase [Gracilibacillus halophilus YIM-C55.5]|uniref:Homoserine O-acetyltransferase n=1 Tax=Gracilibacillus halophilus YIM-C55.5 TaxID=1308866 RepID=N4WPA3_9BACI|nr:homoserine O-succinyltransferase [Gracilibacillus halophilus]ENH96315.1 homoserine O-succinyltransferase [Gracilibacillus halophilus YIM-C55.5]
MPIKIPDLLPAKSKLQDENVFVMDESRAFRQDIRPLQILILNLMPLKQQTETHLLRLLGNSPLQIDVGLLHTSSHVPRHTSLEHLEQFYKSIDDVKDKRYDGLIITGAPIEKLHYEDVTYWDELSQIMEWSKTNVTSTLHICWGAMAGLFYHYGIDKYIRPKKISGIFPHDLKDETEKLLSGFDEEFLAPHSRNADIRKEEIENEPNLKILSESDEAGVYIAASTDGRQIFVTGHPEYDAFTLQKEYERDQQAGLNPDIPVNYFPKNDPNQRPRLRWRTHSNMLISNWLNYYVYQETPYKL